MSIFLEFSIIIVIAAALSGLMRLLKQPLMIGYVLTGLILGPQFLNLLKSTDAVSAFSEMGVAVLLFIVGLNLNPKEIKGFGSSALYIGVLQVIITTLLGFLLSAFLGFSGTESIYIGLALSFSSTIVALKLLADKRDLEKLYGRLSIGILLLQDIVAAVALIFVSTLSNGNNSIQAFIFLIVKSLALTLTISIISVYVLPYVSTFFARSQEYLFVFSLAWGFGLAALFVYLGFSLEIGALVAGVSLSLTPYSSEISAKLKPLKDFFIIIFFIFLGSQITFNNLYALRISLLALLLFIIIGKTFIVTLLSEIFGYNRKTSFLAGASLSQISEFSIILVMLGISTGQIDKNILSVITILTFVSITVSTYLAMKGGKIYPLFSGFLRFFEKKVAEKEQKRSQIYDVVLFGCNRSGYDFIQMFSVLGDKFLAIDFDPEIIKELTNKGINCIYGDAEDSDFLEEINIGKSKIVISTIPDFETNHFLVSHIKFESERTIVVLISYNIDDAIKLYESGATYVILPHFIGGEFAAKLTSEAGFDIERLHGKRKEHIEYLKQRKALGHAHPMW